MPKRRRHRRSRLWTLMWLAAMLGSLTLAAGLGTGVAMAEDEVPPPEVTEEPTQTPPGPIECPGADVGGILPVGSQEIVGTVTNGVDPVADLQVRITTSTGGFGSTSTTATGEFRFESLGNATYFVSFYDNAATYASGFYSGGGATVLDKTDSTGVVLSGSGASGIDAMLTPETYGSISGVVTNDAEAPVGALVSVRGAYFPLVGCDETNGAGEYSITNLRSGVYAIVAESSAYPDATYGSTITVPPDAVDIDLQFPPVYTLSGVVLTAGGAGVENIGVSACETTTGACQEGFSQPETGSFDITGLGAGSYVLRYHDQGGLNAWRTGYYGGEGIFVATEGEATPVSVPGGPVELRAVPAPTVGGTISPPPSIEDTVLVSLCDAYQDNCFADYADEDGLYSVGVTIPGTYFAQVFDFTDTYPSGGYIGAGATIVSPDPADAIEIVVADANIGPINRTLPAGGRISADVSGEADGAYAFLELCTAEFFCPSSAQADDTGLALSQALFAGTYYVKATIDFEQYHWYVSPTEVSTDFADATAIPVTGGATSSISIVLPATGTSTPPGDPEIDLDDGSGTNPIHMDFTGVQEPGGVTSVTASDSGPAVPDGFQLGLPATYYDFTSTAVFDEVQICISYAGVSFISEASLRFFHFDADTSSWEDITDAGYPDTDLDRICGTTDSLSPFVLAERSMSFSGFFQPVDTLALNRAKAGAGIPVKFSLGGDFGLEVFVEGYPSVSQIACPGTTVDAIEQTVSVGSSHLVYDPATNRYTYLFKTSKSWAGTCRQLTLMFTDGTTRTADFQFTK